MSDYKSIPTMILAALSAISCVPASADVSALGVVNKITPQALSTVPPSVLRFYTGKGADIDFHESEAVVRAFTEFHAKKCQVNWALSCLALITDISCDDGKPKNETDATALAELVNNNFDVIWPPYEYYTIKKAQESVDRAPYISMSQRRAGGRTQQGPAADYAETQISDSLRILESVALASGPNQCSRLATLKQDLAAGLLDMRTNYESDIDMALNAIATEAQRAWGAKPILIAPNGEDQWISTACKPLNVAACEKRAVYTLSVDKQESAPAEKTGNLFRSGLELEVAINMRMETRFLSGQGLRVTLALWPNAYNVLTPAARERVDAEFSYRNEEWIWRSGATLDGSVELVGDDTTRFVLFIDSPKIVSDIVKFCVVPSSTGQNANFSPHKTTFCSNVEMSLRLKTEDRKWFRPIRFLLSEVAS